MIPVKDIMRRNATIIGAATMMVVASSLRAEPVARAQPCSSTHPLLRAYFGDLHLHTSYSFDAYLAHGAGNTPDSAYEFARGEPITYRGHRVQRQWPLDFLAVTDHAGYMGTLVQLDDPDSAFSKSDLGRKARAGDESVGKTWVYAIVRGEPIPGLDPRGPAKSAWQRMIEAANDNYVPGEFTTFIGYEWSSTPNGNNLHRNVIFRGADAPLPFSVFDSRKPEDLWSYLESHRQQGIEALAIPHNANASNGLMYSWYDSYGEPIDRTYALRRMMNEPVSEIGQNKGQSETLPALSPRDEFAGFQVYDFLAGRSFAGPGPRKYHGSYIREAYGRGLIIAERIGVNPYKFGVVGSSDIHNGLSTSYENAWGGAGIGIDPNARLFADEIRQRMLHADESSTYWATGSGNLTAVWAERNTREAIYDALRRKEAFATTGTRLRFRLFGGWNYETDILENENWVRQAYRLGVPMGGDLPARPSEEHAPRFIVWAVKDPDGANLDRVQIIKVWLDDGEYAERIFNVVFSGTRTVNPRTGKLPSVGNTVDVETATYTNRIGATELSTVWEDPAFDPAVPALYYLRVLEIPTPRWTTIQAARLGLPIPESVSTTIQERGWSSPIWYAPE